MITDKSFSDFKRDFYNRIGDGSMFDCWDFNLLKVVLDGLTVNYTNSNIHPRYNLFNYEIYSFFRRIKYHNDLKKIKRKVNEKKNIHTLLLDSGSRHIVSDKNKASSFYFEKIKKALIEKDIRFLFIESSSPKPLSALGYDFSVAEFEILAFQPLSAYQKKVLLAIKGKFTEFKKSKIFLEKELENINIAMTLFFRDFVQWDNFLKLSTFKTVLLICHYHKEGFFLAAKNNKVRTIELQHGLVAKEDIYYVFPKQIKDIIKRALFPEKILVFGQFWKDRLLNGIEHTNDEIDIIGYFPQESSFVEEELKKKIQHYIGNRKLILITTQTNWHKEYSEYCENLIKKIDIKQWCIIVKIHPSEKLADYASLQNSKILVLNQGLEYLLAQTTIHAAIYSTTLFDALRYNIRANYSIWYEQYQDYIAGMLEDNIALKVLPEENLVEKYTSGNVLFPPTGKNYYFEDFKSELFK